MNRSNYQGAKKDLKNFAKSLDKSDKPYYNMTLNDYAYHLESDYSLSEYQIILLQNFTCKLHV